MKIKDGLLTLAIAAALGSAGAYAQGPTTRGVTPGDTSIPDPTEEGRRAGTNVSPSISPSDSSSASASTTESSESQMEHRTDSSAATSADERARRGESSSIDSFSSSDSSSSMSHRQAQTDVPPPVDSETVRHIQQALSDQGHKVSVDGIWGDKTHDALRAFQNEQHLDATGQLDGKTFAALGLVEGSQQTASASRQSSSDRSQSSSDSSQSGSDSSQSAATTQRQQNTAQQQAAIESDSSQSSPGSNQ